MIGKANQLDIWAILDALSLPSKLDYKDPLWGPQRFSTMVTPHLSCLCSLTHKNFIVPFDGHPKSLFQTQNQLRRCGIGIHQGGWYVWKGNAQIETVKSYIQGKYILWKWNAQLGICHQSPSWGNQRFSVIVTPHWSCPMSALPAQKNFPDFIPHFDNHPGPLFQTQNQIRRCRQGRRRERF